MNRNEYVTMFGLETVRSINPRRDRYQFNAKHKWKWVRWLQVGMFYALTRMGALSYARDEVSKAVRVPLDSKGVIDLVWRVRCDTMCMLGRPPTKILIGAVDYEELVNMPGVLVGMRDVLRMESPVSYNNTMFNIPIEVVPQMSGVVVLP